MARLLTSSVTDLPLTHEPLPAADVIGPGPAGAPTAAVQPLDSLGGVEVGVWEMSAGSATDVEVDEVFVVLTGRGTVTFDDGETIALAPGVTVRLHAGEHTSWRIEEPLRKVYLALG